MSESLLQTQAITLTDVLAARERIRSSVYYSPCPRSEMLSNLTGQQVHLKLENLQMTGSFKERGALNRLTLMTPEERSRGVVAASAGNHAQGVAYHSTRLGVRSIIVMPLATPLVKVTATRNFGAEVILHGANYDEAYAEATRICEAEGMVFLHPFDDPAVMAGQGTIALEMLEQVPHLEAVIVPIGGGGLIGGIATAIKESNPNIRVIGVQTSRLPSMSAAITAGHPITIDAATTIADGIAVRRAGTLTYPVIARYVDEIVTVDEDEIASAILVLLEREKTLAEGAGAAALAALLQGKTSLGTRSGVNVGVLVCGGNIDVTLLSRIIERGLVQDGRLILLRIHLLDKPGALADLTKLIASHRANIVNTLYNRAYYGVNLGDTVIDITMETRGKEQVAELLGALTREGYRHSRVQ
ncbi:threonine ammonia-lyase [Granulicella tundricola]|uniref:Threonine dehydratase n=1 Tax=Granulicella tundricola (strain ATCC BAA-1859 / DSM 23138 / MP5ACTX9) TaxID=1198114 RepID=E8WXC9_GRATM|nr:threonine ammonia-lyase [Granulicella tundricola]ADW67462.1 threonine dehydratase [Granulicella tundricola MP5ACTX9]